MHKSALDRILHIASTEAALEETLVYLTEQLGRIVKKNEKVLICFPTSDEASFGGLIKKAVVNCGGRPVIWEEDLRWRTLLMLAFLSRAVVMIAPPMIVLGISKLSKQKGIPLNIRKVLLAGYPSQDWMIEGITRGLDCSIDGCFAPAGGPVVAGFSCTCGKGIHVRDSTFDVDIIDNDGNSLPSGHRGQVILFPKEDPTARIGVNSCASLQLGSCGCGNPAPKLIGIDFSDRFFQPIDRIRESLLYWSSILDCRVDKTDYGLELEVIVFPGEQLPKLPSCARLIVRPWNPDKDIPISLSYNWQKPDFYEDSH